MSSCQNFSLLFFCKELSVRPWSRACAPQLSVPEPRTLTCHCSLSPSFPSPSAPFVQPVPQPTAPASSVIATSWPHQPTAVSPITIVKLHKEFQSSFLPSPADFPAPKDTSSPPACATLPRSKALLAVDLTFRVAKTVSHPAACTLRRWSHWATWESETRNETGRKSGHVAPSPALCWGFICRLGWNHIFPLWGLFSLPRSQTSDSSNGATLWHKHGAVLLRCSQT